MKGVLQSLLVVIGTSLFLTGCSTQNQSTASSPIKHQKLTQAISPCTIKNPPLSPVKETASKATLARYHRQRWKTVPSLSIKPQKTYIADVYTTAGTFSLRLFSKWAPTAVNNFIFLANHHFYDGDTFFRVVKGYMVQTGDPLQNGTGGPGYTWPDELPPHEAYKQGIVAMANRGPNTNGSQFFIVTAHDAQILDQNPNYTQFGQVIHGMSVVLKISDARVTYNPLMGELSKPIKPVQIVHITIHTC